MKSRSMWSMSGASLVGFAAGLAAGVATGLLAAPMRGRDMRASLRSRADDALDHGRMLVEDGRRAFSRSDGAAGARAAAAVTPPGTLTASLGDIAQLHAEPLPAEAQP